MQFIAVQRQDIIELGLESGECVVLRRFDALSVSVLLLSCTALLTYSLLYLDRWPIALYQPLLIFGIPFVYLIVKRSYSDRKRALKWVLPTRLRRYGLRPSGKTKGSTEC